MQLGQGAAREQGLAGIAGDGQAVRGLGIERDEQHLAREAELEDEHGNGRHQEDAHILGRHAENASLKENVVRLADGHVGRQVDPSEDAAVVGRCGIEFDEDHAFLAQRLSRRRQRPAPRPRRPRPSQTPGRRCQT